MKPRDIPSEIPREIRTFRDLRASMTPIMRTRAIVLVSILAVGALIGLAVVLALVLGSILAAIHGFQRVDSAALITISQASATHA